MPYFAAALARTESGWSGSEVDLDDFDDLEGLADHLRDLVEDGPGPALMLLEQDDEYVAVVRVEGGASLVEPRVFLSDRRAVLADGVAAMLWEDGDDDEDEDDDEGTRPVAEPVGDAALLSDLGTSADELVRLCAEEGSLPADVHTAVCERAGCLPELEALRDG
ncbi:MAG: hypothetical protein JWO60_1098 [Frankiales bacterium]|nr:hypothetical protein [Frankiales bacterium]